MNLEDLYERFATDGNTYWSRFSSRFLRAGYAYYSVISGENVIISLSTHEYNKFKSFLVYVGMFAPITLNKYYLRKIVEITRIKSKLFVLPAIVGVHAATSALGGISALGIIHVWKKLRSMYFASYLATLAFIIDDPQDKVYKQSKIMRNAL